MMRGERIENEQKKIIKNEREPGFGLAWVGMGLHTQNLSDSTPCCGDNKNKQGTCGLVAMTSASHAEGCQLDPGQVYIFLLHAVHSLHKLC